MAWLIGIDEAGYGPNLGPLVMTAVACRLPQELLDADLWQVLQEAVRRPETDADGRLAVGDSKALYSTARGLGDLEAAVWAALYPERRPCRLSDHVAGLGDGLVAELGEEGWYAGTTLLPYAVEPARLAAMATVFRRACTGQGIRFGPVQTVVIGARRFNDLLERWGTKGAVLGYSLTTLLQGTRWLGEAGEPLRYVVDKHGGRNTYTAMLQDALPEGVVVVRRESPGCSEYELLGADRPLRLSFQPRADAEHFCVALASMASKYLRELLMHEFNAFWQRQVPGLKPTAGYPGDAVRFLQAIRPVLTRLGLKEEAVWRRK